MLCNLNLSFENQVDKHIRRLDSDLARFETEIKEKSSVATLSAEEDTPPVVKSKILSCKNKPHFSKIFCFSAEDKKKSVEKIEKKKKGNKTSTSAASETPVKGIKTIMLGNFSCAISTPLISTVEEGPIRKKSSKKNVAAATTPESSVNFGITTIGHSADVLDMPVDPNEPTYCLCHQVSYGEMIGCDNPDVKYFKFYVLVVL